MRRTKAEALQTRDAVLQAAAQLLVQLGVGAFTIDAVAQQAGITKGGVLHHFPSKEALLVGLIDQVIETFDRRLNEELAAEPPGAPGRRLRAYIRTVFAVRHADMQLVPVLAAVVAADHRILGRHRILDRIRREFEESQRAAAEDGIDPIEATVLRLAVDGIVFARALGLDVLDAPTSQAVLDALLRRTAVPEATA